MLETVGQPIASPKRSSALIAVSALFHLMWIGALIQWSAIRVTPIQRPGSDKGTLLLLTYSPGGAHLQASPTDSAIVSKPAKPTLPSPLPQKTDTSSATKVSASISKPDPGAGEDALGSGNMKIAMLDFCPTPEPDLSQLPRGTKGDVILDVVIDETGKVAGITMTSGVGHGVDEAVITTVRRWTFHPATKDGRAVASEHEVRFHYEA